MKAVHFGAGNIGRGFVGLLLHEAGYEVVFADVNAELIEALAAADSYDVRLVGDESVTKTVTGFRALNSATAEDELVAEIATADVVTTAVGPRILRFVAPVIARGLAARATDAPRLAVMACENAIGATDLLAAELMEGLPDDDARAELAARAVFANTAVDRIVPAQDPATGVDVTVETFFEWVVDRSPFAGSEPPIPGARFVDSLGPYIERKLFTVNTGHATTAYTGFLEGATTISEAIAMPTVLAAVESALTETSAALTAKHGLDPEELAEYRAKILNRFRNPHLVDEVTRVGREPLRKLGRDDRFIGPASDYARYVGVVPSALFAAVGAALRFDLPEDSQSVELRQLLREAEPADIVAEVMGVEPGDALYEPLVAVVRAAQG
ncbi:mannitol-1-phosphate 5-dehydrogenase [Leifsonia xyli subsp. cynodontis DSM 46306]|uniref:Mannitol-1-phosphate 5-dehydrogenase n=1 Tax=Leifsonia xyli subsp. cynodontis DSM 46306 TaxID=1389489 RepID=U3P3N6_LEIXC|nr:mannitol-1-phosphate 5-dehydrogenase [Leifsonia xyli]AGW40356.1 mannitol-1-phosphate 5-dehydrogenase [Leifsonia xyli subsp. cynodontis DSM 46306]